MCPSPYFPLSIVNNMIWSKQVVIPVTQKAHPSRTRHGSLSRKESYATKVVNDAMDRVAMAAQRMRKSPSPKPILEEDESDEHPLPKVTSGNGFPSHCVYLCVYSTVCVCVCALVYVCMYV